MTTPSVERPLPSRVVRQEFFEIDLRSDGIVWLTRLPKAYTTIASLHRAYDEMLSAVDSWLLERRILQRHIGTRQRTMMGWLYDVRDVRSHRNDDAFERAVQKRQLDLVKRSPLVAVLVKTAAGRAQMHRSGAPRTRVTQKCSMMTLPRSRGCWKGCIQRSQANASADGEPREIGSFGSSGGAQRRRGFDRLCRRARGMISLQTRVPPAYLIGSFEHA